MGAKIVTTMARKLRRLARRKRITLPRVSEEANWHNTKCGHSKNASLSSSLSSTSTSKIEKGHFVVYTVDSRRLVLPLAYLDNAIFRELLNLAEEEFGLPSNMPLTLPFDSVFVDYLIWLIQRNVASEIVEKALLTAIPSNRCCLSYPYVNVQEQENQCSMIQGF